MKLTRLIVAVVLLAGLGGVVWWSNKQEDAKAAKPPVDPTPKILTLKDSEIRQIEVDHRGGENTVVKKNDAGQWQIISPKTLPTEQGAAGNLSTAVANVSAERVVDPNVTDLATYGLSPAVLTIKIDSGNGKTSTLLVGEETPTGSIYAKLDGDPKLYTISKNVDAQLDKASKDLRDKRLLTFDSNQLSRVQLNTPGQPPVEFGRAGAMQWQILKPKPMRADSTQVEDFVGRLHDAQMDTSLTEEDAKKNAAAFASAPSAATVTVTEPGGTQTLEVHKSKDDYYGKSSVVEGVYKLTAADLNKFFDKKVDDFRAKKIFDFGFSDPTHIEIKDGPKTLSLEKVGDNWVSSGKTMDTVSVQALVDKLRDMSASKLLDSGFGSPVIDMTVVSDDGKHTEKVQIAPAGKDFMARRENDSTLYQLDASAVQDLRTSMGDVKEQPPQQPQKK